MEIMIIAALHAAPLLLVACFFPKEEALKAVAGIMIVAAFMLGSIAYVLVDIAAIVLGYIGAKEMIESQQKLKPPASQDEHSDTSEDGLAKLVYAVIGVLMILLLIMG